MSLPPGFLDELRSRLSLSQVVGRKVAWDRKKSNQAKGDMWAPCPFHHEKTASFHVDDGKGFYYCFGCHAKGDLIGFVKETENVGFMQAVEILAREAGMAMPAPDPAAKAKTDHRAELVAAMDVALAYFRRQLGSGAGAAARDYLAGRGLDRDACNRWEIGVAPNARRGLAEHLEAKGVPLDRAIDAGLVTRPDDGGAPYDRFRDRIIFPIRDARGRCVAFGGRAMSPNARAKYLNSPETDLFSKGRVLYNHANARRAVGQGADLIVAEGYMDVIALAEAGFEGAVAPLGTAVTEDQLAHLWRLGEPVFALDGDAAGLGAGRRLIDLALPLMKAGQGLRFAIMPPGKDPDDLIRDQGAAGMRAVIDAAQPMVRMLWHRETEGERIDSAERRAALDQRLTAIAETISDKTLRYHVLQDLRGLQREAFGRGQGGPRRRSADQGSATVQAKQSTLMSGPRADTDLREAVILAIALATPQVLDRFGDAIADLPFANANHRALRAALLDWHVGQAGTARDWVAARLGESAVENLLSARHVSVIPALRAPGEVDLAEMCLAEELAKLSARQGLADEMREACEDVGRGPPDRIAWRLAQASEARNRADRPEREDPTQFDTGDNGARLDRDEREAFDHLIGRIDFTKPRRR